MNLVGNPINWAALVPDSRWGRFSGDIAHWLVLHAEEDAYYQWIDSYPAASDVLGGPGFIAEVVNECVEWIMEEQQ